MVVDFIRRRDELAEVAAVEWRRSAGGATKTQSKPFTFFLTESIFTKSHKNNDNC